MNWQAISFDWNQVRAFLATAEEGSFSAAARALSSTQPTVGRQVTGLEHDLGVTLFERGTRGLVLTAAGRDLLEHVRVMGDAASRMSMVAAGQSQDITGEVSVTVVDLLASQYVIPVLQHLRDVAPGLDVRILATNEIQNLAKREADIAVRHLRPDQPDLVARLVATYRANFYATPAHLDRVGRPRGLQDLSGMKIIGVPEPDPFMRLMADKGIELRPEQFIYACDSGRIIYDMARAGLGVAMLPEDICDNDPALEKVCPEAQPIEFPVWLTAHKELHTSRRIRLVFDALAEELARPRTVSGR